MGSREKILGRLRAARQPFKELPPFENPRHMVPAETVPDLVARFMQEVEKLSCKAVRFDPPEAAVDYIVNVIRTAPRAPELPAETPLKISTWDFGYIPLPGLKEGLEQAGIPISDSNDAEVRVGITGAAAALAATGSLVMRSGAGRPRKVSLLPYVHIAVITVDQLVLDFETWMQQQRERGLDDFRAACNTTLITGSSRTADIAMETILGAHGPVVVHVVVMGRG
jgi:L-lactate dehydrogenase complex protein LldG